MSRSVQALVLIALVFGIALTGVFVGHRLLPRPASKPRILVGVRNDSAHVLFVRADGQAIDCAIPVSWEQAAVVPAAREYLLSFPSLDGEYVEIVTGTCEAGPFSVASVTP